MKCQASVTKPAQTGIFLHPRLVCWSGKISGEHQHNVVRRQQSKAWGHRAESRRSCHSQHQSLKYSSGFPSCIYHSSFFILHSCDYPVQILLFLFIQSFRLPLSPLLFRITLFLYVCVCDEMDRYSFEYLMNCWMSKMHNLPQFPSQLPDTQMMGGLKWVWRGGWENEIERHFIKQRLYYSVWISLASTENFGTSLSKWPQSVNSGQVK